MGGLQVPAAGSGRAQVRGRTRHLPRPLLLHREHLDLMVPIPWGCGNDYSRDVMYSSREPGAQEIVTLVVLPSVGLSERSFLPLDQRGFLLHPTSGFHSSSKGPPVPGPKGQL